MVSIPHFSDYSLVLLSGGHFTFYPCGMGLPNLVSLQVGNSKLITDAGVTAFCHQLAKVWWRKTEVEKRDRLIGGNARPRCRWEEVGADADAAVDLQAPRLRKFGLR